MTWVRCPSCRTINDLERYPLCGGCFRPLPSPGLAAPAPPPRPLPAEKDQKAAKPLTWTTLAILLLGLLLLPLGGFLLPYLVVLGIAGAYARRNSPSGGKIGKVLGVLTTILAVLGGILLLVFLACIAVVSTIK